MQPTNTTASRLRTSLLALGAGLLAGAGLGACSSTNVYERPHALLVESAAKLDAGQLQAADQTLETLLAETNAEAGDFALQRFYASLLLTHLNVDASFGHAFMTEKASGGAGPAGLGGIGTGSKAPAGEQPSTVGHILAAMLHATNALEWAPAADKSPAEVDGQALVPANVASLGNQRGNTYLVLSRMIGYGRLGFGDRVEQILNQSPPLLTQATCEGVLDQAGLTGAARAWTYYLIHRHLAGKNEAEAYKFAVRTLASAGEAEGTLSAADLAAVSTWITSGSKYVFKCPQCKTAVIPSFGECVNDGTPLIEFYGEVK